MGLVDKSELLKELRIDRGAAEAPTSRRGVWVAVALVLVAALGVGAWFALAGPAALPVGTAVAKAMPANGANSAASVLDATGYVTARRSAIVSASPGSSAAAAPAPIAPRTGRRSATTPRRGWTSAAATPR